MTITLHSNREHKGFSLKSPINFDGYLCIITGKNGSGKTRLLESMRVATITTQDGIESIQTNNTALINTEIPSRNNFVNEGNYLINDHISTRLMLALMGKDDLDEIHTSWTIEIFEPNGTVMGQSSFNPREIFKRATKTFKKSLSELTRDELKLSIIINNEYGRAELDGYSSLLNNCLSQLSINYYQAKDLDATLRAKGVYKLEENEKLATLLRDYFGNCAPEINFSSIVEKLFRNKFKVSSPPVRESTFNYTPALISTESETKISISELSSGEKVIFWLALSTFEAIYTKYHPSFKGSKIIMLDEPDAHLHPQMILDFYECLKSFHDQMDINFIFTTHSPTTVALSPSDNIFNLEYDSEGKFTAQKVSKDRAISELLDGVSQIAIDPENSRQVYVENENDGATYELIYSNIKNRSSLIDKGITLSFISAGQKIAKTELEKHIKAVYGENHEKMENLINRINGSGSCGQVIGVVEYLKEGGSRTVRGLIDWDNTQRNHDESVKVSAKDYAYSIENLVYDPLSLYAFLTSNRYYSCNYFFSCEDDFAWRKAIDDQALMQKIIDVITYDLFGRENLRNHTIKYMNGMILLGDKEYFIPSEGSNGHDFERVILNKYPKLNEIFKRTSGLPFVYYFTSKVTLGLLSWEYLNQQFELTFSELQK
ncbi:AAA family ATPase [Erwinia sp. OPT-41]|uniref:AAA family ATPase n=1 Tax=Erwinia plantamica TaxID=3237104 RepID=A0ABW7CQ53_9GAMM